MPRCIIVPMPVSPIERLAVQFRNVLHMPDPRNLYMLMGSAAANMIEGAPVWPMLVGPPGCGKSELLLSLKGIPNTVEAADITGAAAFLSGTSRKETSKDATGGLLRQVGDQGGLILNDFTSVLSKPADQIATIMAVFRECYIGSWTRLVGGEGGRSLSWTGKLALYAGVTGKIDQHQQVSAELGERWIYWRYEPTDGFAESMVVLSDDRNGEWRKQLQAIVAKFFEDLGLQYRGNSKPRREFRNPEKLRIYRMASVAVRCRSGVSRDPFTKEINSPRETEAVTRLVSVLGQLLVGMDYIGVPAPASWRILSKVCLDSMPRLRRIIVEALVKGPMLIDSLQPICGCHPKVIQRAVEDLEMHEIVTVDGRGIKYSGWMTENYKGLGLK